MKFTISTIAAALLSCATAVKLTSETAIGNLRGSRGGWRLAEQGSYQPSCETIQESLVALFETKDEDLKAEIEANFDQSQWAELGASICQVPLTTLSQFFNCIHFGNTAQDLEECLYELHNANSWEEDDSIYTPDTVTNTTRCEDIQQTTMDVFQMKDEDVKAEIRANFTDTQWDELGAFICQVPETTLSYFWSCIYYGNTTQDLEECLYEIHNFNNGTSWEEDDYIYRPDNGTSWEEDDSNYTPDTIEFDDQCLAILQTLLGYFDMKDEDVQDELRANFTTAQEDELGAFICQVPETTLYTFQVCVFYGNTTQDLEGCLNELYNRPTYEQDESDYMQTVCNARLGHLGWLYSQLDQQIQTDFAESFAPGEWEQTGERICQMDEASAWMLAQCLAQSASVEDLSRCV